MNDIIKEIEKIEDLFINANYQEAFEAFNCLCELHNFDDLKNSANIILSRYNSLCIDDEKGIIPLSDKVVQKNQIADSFLSCMKRLKDHLRGKLSEARPKDDSDLQLKKILFSHRFDKKFLPIFIAVVLFLIALPFRHHLKPMMIKTKCWFDLPQNAAFEPIKGFEFVWIPCGCYNMGCDAQDCHDWEKPVHEVCVDGVWLGKYEVTQAQWKDIMENHLFAYPDDKHPAEMVTWEDTQQFIEKLQKKTDMKYKFRLPTEAEWEYACRSCGKQEKYPGYAKIRDINRIIWYNAISNGSTHPIATREPNELGIYDMGGNVWEWCSDMYAPDAYSKHQTYNPVIGDGTDRVIRGGSWSSAKEEVRCTYRIGSPPEKRSNDIGFRLVMMPIKKK